MTFDWIVPVLMPIAATAATTALAQGTQVPYTVTADWGQLAAVAGVVTAACSGLNAWQSRSMKIALNEKVETVKGHMDHGFDKLREELARKDLTDQRFREIERRTQLLEQDRRVIVGRAIQRDEEHRGE